MYLQVEADSVGQGLSPVDHPSLQMLVTCLDYYLCFWPNDCKSKVCMTPSLGLINLPEQPIELRETRLLSKVPIYYKKILKDMNQ